MINSSGSNQIFLGDCLDILPQSVCKNSIDMILTDLPYGITQNQWDLDLDLEKLFQQFKRILKNNGVIVLTASQPFTSILVTANIEIFKHEWIWEKDAGSNFANTIREPMKEHESVLVFSKGNWTYNPIKETRVGSRKDKVTSSRYETKTENYNKFSKTIDAIVPELRVPRSIQRFNRERGLHPTQKPIKLFEYLIKTYTNEGDTILDCCAGSGTTAIACMNTNREYICIEKDEGYFKIMQDRIANTTQSLEVFSQ